MEVRSRSGTTYPGEDILVGRLVNAGGALGDGRECLLDGLGLEELADKFDSLNQDGLVKRVGERAPVDCDLVPWVGGGDLDVAAGEGTRDDSTETDKLGGGGVLDDSLESELTLLRIALDDGLVKSRAKEFGSILDRSRVKDLLPVLRREELKVEVVDVNLGGHGEPAGAVLLELYELFVAEGLVGDKGCGIHLPVDGKVGDDVGVVLKVVADAGEDDAGLNLVLLEDIGWADTGELEELGSVKGTSSEDNFALGFGDSGLDLGPLCEFDADSLVLVKLDGGDGVFGDEVEILAARDLVVVFILCIRTNPFLGTDGVGNVERADLVTGLAILRTGDTEGSFSGGPLL